MQLGWSCGPQRSNKLFIKDLDLVFCRHQTFLWHTHHIHKRTAFFPATHLYSLRKSKYIFRKMESIHLKDQIFYNTYKCPSLCLPCILPFFNICFQFIDHQNSGPKCVMSFRSSDLWLWLFTFIQSSVVLTLSCLSEYHKMSCLSGQWRCHNTALKCPDMDQTLHRGTTGWYHWVWNAGLCACRYSDLMTCCNLLFVIPRSQSLPHFGHHTPPACLGPSQVRMSKERGGEGLQSNKAHFCGQLVDYHQCKC